ncbi:hypothetical protein FQN54_001825 [Arachnomyces sp. PD_36]|nr:hypothetical protein FQN54_001825 [Arachnomyces sp. PD_36]
MSYDDLNMDFPMGNTDPMMDPMMDPIPIEDLITGPLADFNTDFSMDLDMDFIADFNADFNAEPIPAPTPGPSAPIPEPIPQPNRRMGSRRRGRSAAIRLCNNQAFPKIIALCDPPTWIALRLVNKHMYTLVSDHLIETGTKMLSTPISDAERSTPRWKKSFPKSTLQFLYSKYRSRELARLMMIFARDYTEFRPTAAMSEEEIETRMAEGWYTNLTLRNIYREQTCWLRNDKEALLTIDEPDGMENLKNLNLSRDALDYSPDKCYNFLLLHKYFEAFIRLIVSGIWEDWKAISTQDRHRIKWIFIQEGANYLETVFRETGERKVLDHLSPELKVQAKTQCIDRFSAMDTELRVIREAHADELLRMLKARTGKLEDEKYKETLSEFPTPGPQQPVLY